MKIPNKPTLNYYCNNNNRIESISTETKSMLLFVQFKPQNYFNYRHFCCNYNGHFCTVPNWFIINNKNNEL